MKSSSLVGVGVMETEVTTLVSWATTALARRSNVETEMDASMILVRSYYRVIVEKGKKSRTLTLKCQLHSSL